MRRNKTMNPVPKRTSSERENPLPGFPRLLTEKETAAILGVMAPTLTTWRSTQRYPLAYVKIGHYVRYREQDVLDFLNRRTVSPQVPEATQPSSHGRSSGTQKTPGKRRSITRP